MAKDPAFLFYPGDYLRDTQCLSEAVQVAYDRIMCEHMRNICISYKQISFFTKRLTDSQKEELMAILVKIDDGYCIDWVRESVIKRRAYSKSRSENRLHKDQNHMSIISKSYDNHMENENENENKALKALNLEKSKRFKKPTLEQVVEYCKEIKTTVDPETFFHTYESSGWIKANGQRVLNWKSTIRTWEKKQQKTPLTTINALPQGKPQAEMIAIQQVAMKLTDEQIKDNMLAQGYTEQRIYEAITKARGQTVK